MIHSGRINLWPLWGLVLTVLLAGCMSGDYSGVTSVNEIAWIPADAEVFQALPNSGYFWPGSRPCVAHLANGDTAVVVGYSNNYMKVSLIIQVMDRTGVIPLDKFADREALLSCVSDAVRGLRVESGTQGSPSQPSFPTVGEDISSASALPPVMYFPLLMGGGGTEWPQSYFLESGFACEGKEIEAVGYSKEPRRFFFRTGISEEIQSGDPRDVLDWREIVSCLSSGGHPLIEKFFFMSDTTGTEQEFGTEEEALAYGENQYDAGQIFSRIGVRRSGWTQYVRGWKAPEGLWGTGPEDTYFLDTANGVYYPTLEEAIQASEIKSEASEIRRFVRGNDLGIEKTYPVFSPPQVKDASGVSREILPLEKYYTFGQEIYLAEADVLTAARDLRDGPILSGGDIHTMRRGQDIAPVVTVPLCVLPPELPSDWAAEDPYFVREDGTVYERFDSAYFQWTMFFSSEKWVSELIRCEEQSRTPSTQVGWTPIGLLGVVFLLAILINFHSHSDY